MEENDMEDDKGFHGDTVRSQWVIWGMEVSAEIEEALKICMIRIAVIGVCSFLIAAGWSQDLMIGLRWSAVGIGGAGAFAAFLSMVVVLNSD